MNDCQRGWTMMHKELTCVNPVQFNLHEVLALEIVVCNIAFEENIAQTRQFQIPENCRPHGHD